MPYIKREQRARINRPLADVLAVVRDLSAGELNYLITMVLRAWTNDATYGRYNEAVGVLECSKLELYRRAIAPYENQKATINGDIYAAGSALASRES